MGRLVVLGSINADQVIEVKKVPAVGETILGGAPLIMQGGKGANQAVAAARAGAEVAMLGCVGDDPFGKAAVEALAAEGIDVAGVRRVDVPTGTAVILKMPGDNAIVVSPGANGCVNEDVVDEADARLSGSSVLLAQLEVPLETVGQAFVEAKERGLTTVLNPAPFQELSEEMLGSVDFLTPNETEFMRLVGRDEGLGELSEAELEGLMAAWEGGHASRLVVTMGERGVYFLENRILRRVPCMPVEVVDTTGAGDTFSGVFAAGLAEGRAFEDALSRAQLASNLSVRCLGAREGMPAAGELSEGALCRAC